MRNAAVVLVEVQRRVDRLRSGAGHRDRATDGRALALDQRVHAAISCVRDLEDVPTLLQQLVEPAVVGDVELKTIDLTTSIEGQEHDALKARHP